MSQDPTPQKPETDQPAEGCGCECAGTPKPSDPPTLASFLKKKPTRRDMMIMVGAGLNVAAAAMMGIPILGYVLANFKARSPQAWINLGPLEQFPENETRMASYRNPDAKSWDGVTADIPCWVRRMDGENFQVFAINCAHLGCPVRWFSESKLFLCPCHGGVYYEDGSRASGPPPRGLYEYPYKVEGGELFVKGGQIPTLSQPV